MTGGGSNGASLSLREVSAAVGAFEGMSSSREPRYPIQVTQILALSQSRVDFSRNKCFLTSCVEDACCVKESAIMARVGVGHLTISALRRPKPEKSAMIG